MFQIHTQGRVDPDGNLSILMFASSVVGDEFVQHLARLVGAVLAIAIWDGKGPTGRLTLFLIRSVVMDLHGNRAGGLPIEFNTLALVANFTRVTGNKHRSGSLGIE